MYKRGLYNAFKEGHTRFLVNKMSGNDTGAITLWVRDKLVSSDSDISQESKNAFFDAEKLLIVEYIMAQNLSGLTKLLDAVDNEALKDAANYKRLKLNQCRVLTDAMKRAERFLKGGNVMHEGLRKLLEDRQKELQGMECTAEEQSFKEKISTAINEALEIVPVASSAKISK